MRLIPPTNDLPVGNSVVALLTTIRSLFTDTCYYSLHRKRNERSEHNSEIKIQRADGADIVQDDEEGTLTNEYDITTTEWLPVLFGTVNTRVADEDCDTLAPISCKSTSNIGKEEYILKNLNLGEI